MRKKKNRKSVSTKHISYGSLTIFERVFVAKWILNAEKHLKCRILNKKQNNKNINSWSSATTWILIWTRDFILFFCFLSCIECECESSRNWTTKIFMKNVLVIKKHFLSCICSDESKRLPDLHKCTEQLKWSGI